MADDFEIGSYANNRGQGSLANEFEGFISNFRWVKGEALYLSNFTVPSTPLTPAGGSPAGVLTSLLTCQGTGAIVDAKLNTPNVITANGGVTTTSLKTAPSYTDNGPGYWEFDGVDDGITIPYTPNLAFTDAILSCEAWIYADTLVDGGKEFSIINKRGNNQTQNTNRPYVLGVNGDGRIRWILDGATTVCDTATGLIQTGQWYHIAATHDGTDAKIYVNGVLNTTQSSGTSSLDDTGDIPTRILLISNSGINYNDGSIGEVRVYPRGSNSSTSLPELQLY